MLPKLVLITAIWLTEEGVEASVPGKIFLLVEAKMPLAHHVSRVACPSQCVSHSKIVQRETVWLARLNYHVLETCMGLSQVRGWWLMGLMVVVMVVSGGGSGSGGGGGDGGDDG